MNKADGASLMNSSSSSCNSAFDCGNGIIIRYPFWRVNKMTSSVFCGYPGFGISCFEAGRPPILRSPTDSFYVRSINYSSHTFTLVDADLLDFHASCPTPTYNVSFSNLPNVSYTSSDRNLTLFFNCNSYPIHEHANFSPISCLSTKPNMSFALTEEEFLKLQQGSDWNWDLHCEYSLVLPVSWSGYMKDLSFGYTRVLQSGFELKWGRARNCADCEDSGGRCGYNDTPMEKEFLCFCSDGVRVGSTTCNTVTSHRLHLGVKLIIGFTSLAGGIITGCGAFFTYKRCRYCNEGFFNATKGRSLSSLSSTPISRKTTSNPILTDLENGSANIKFGVQLFTYEELEEATNNFDSDKELGYGGFGTVYHGKLGDRREVAIKRLNENNYKRVEHFKNEVHILTRLRHQNLVKLYGCTSRHCRELLLVYEFIPNGTVSDHLHGDRKTETGSLTWPTRMSIAIETAIALSYLHASDIIHRDVKTNNILLDNNFRVKVADFGLSRLFPTDVTHVSSAPQGTPGYVDPEYQQCYQLSEKSDVYSFGVVLVELISSKPAVDITRHRHEINLSNLAINKIQSQALHELVDPCLGFESDYIIKKMMTAVAELAFHCLQLEKEMRPTMNEVLEYLKQIETEDYSVKPEVVQEDTTGLL